MKASRIAMVVKGYPRLSETFIAQEILALEGRGIPIEIWSLRHPTEKSVHPMHRQIRAPVAYLPEYLYQEPLRVLRGLAFAVQQAPIRRLMGLFFTDLRRDATPNRLRRLGQAFVMARELPRGVHLHVHYLHTPASVVRYAAILRDITWSFSAHAKDIWTTPDWEIGEKIAESLWGVTCTAQGHRRLAALAPAPDRVALVYHGLDFSRFPAPPDRPARDGGDPHDPVRIVSVGRAVAKKGYGDLLTALAALPGDLHWHFAHIGGGELLGALKAQAGRDGIGNRVAFLGARPQPEVIDALRGADIFVLPAKEAPSGDRDGLPNVLMEAASQQLAIVASDFAGIPEFIRDQEDGVLIQPGDWAGLANALNLLARDPDRREQLGKAAFARLRRDFDMTAGIGALERRFRAILGLPEKAGEDAAAAAVPETTPP